MNSWSQLNITAEDLLDNYVHTQHINFRGSKNLAFGFLPLQTDLTADTFVNLELMASTVTIYE